MIKTFRDLNVWKSSHRLVLEIYKITQKFPKGEKFAFVSQIRRSALSVPTNIVEGFKRKSKKDYAHFINMADSSLEETKYQIILAKELGYITDEEFRFFGGLCDDIGRMLHGFYKNLTKN